MKKLATHMGSGYHAVLLLLGILACNGNNFHSGGGGATSAPTPLPQPSEIEAIPKTPTPSTGLPSSCDQFHLATGYKDPVVGKTIKLWQQPSSYADSNTFCQGQGGTLIPNNQPVSQAFYDCFHDLNFWMAPNDSKFPVATQTPVLVGVPNSHLDTKEDNVLCLLNQ